ncbi:hypothetical protein H8959_003698 [Pygathrix nigripes]
MVGQAGHLTAAGAGLPEAGKSHERLTARHCYEHGVDRSLCPPQPCIFLCPSLHCHRWGHPDSASQGKETPLSLSTAPSHPPCCGQRAGLPSSSPEVSQPSDLDLQDIEEVEVGRDTFWPDSEPEPEQAPRSPGSQAPDEGAGGALRSLLRSHPRRARCGAGFGPESSAERPAGQPPGAVPCTQPRGAWRVTLVPQAAAGPEGAPERAAELGVNFACSGTGHNIPEPSWDACNPELCSASWSRPSPSSSDLHHSSRLSGRPPQGWFGALSHPYQLCPERNLDADHREHLQLNGQSPTHTTSKPTPPLLSLLRPRTSILSLRPLPPPRSDQESS